MLFLEALVGFIIKATRLFMTSLTLMEIVIWNSRASKGCKNAKSAIFFQDGYFSIIDKMSI